MIKIHTYNEKDKFVHNKKYYLNEEYFNNIDTENKAYILGFLSSDGCVDKSTNNIKISLKNEESEIILLNKIIQELNFTGNYKIVKNNKYIELTITSFRLKDRLLSIGIIPNKTVNLDLKKVVDNIPKCFYKDFLRGYFDGDGCISISQQKYKNSIYNVPTFHIIALTKNIKTLVSLFNANFNFTISKEKRSKIDMSYIKVCSKNKIKFIYDFMYSENDYMYLKRKKDIFKKYLNIIS